jgi:hypothetical protein
MNILKKDGSSAFDAHQFELAFCNAFPGWRQGDPAISRLFQVRDVTLYLLT